MTEKTASEKRQFKRIPHREAVRIAFKGLPDQGGSISRDLSEGGIRLDFCRFIPLNTEVVLQIQLTPQKTVEETGRVVWIQKMPFMERYRAGMAFTEERSYVSSKTAIRDFIEKNV